MEESKALANNAPSNSHSVYQNNTQKEQPFLKQAEPSEFEEGQVSEDEGELDQ